jgi:hypothetical protein
MQSNTMPVQQASLISAIASDDVMMPPGLPRASVLFRRGRSCCKAAAGLTFTSIPTPQLLERCLWLFYLFLSFLLS